MQGTWLAMGCAVLSLGACASGAGQDARNQPEAPRVIVSADALLFVSFDADRDLKVSQGEVQSGIEAAWRQADANADGALSPLEFQGWSQAALGGSQMPPYRLEFDRNVDNSISGDEFRTELVARAADYDADSDTFLSRAEFLRPLAQARLLRDAPARGGEAPGGQRRPPPR